jgi:type IV pilus assembly protein PilQ
MRNSDNRHQWLTRALGRLGLFAALALSAFWSHAQVAIESVTGSLQSGVEVVRIDLSQAPTALPTGFSIQSPARVALDFPNVVSTLGRTNVDINQGNLRSVSVVQAGSRTRVVLNLKHFTNYKMQLQGKSVLVVLEALAGTTPAVGSQVFASVQSRDVQSLKDIDFRRGDGGAGRVLVSLPNNQVGVDIRRNGKNLVVEFVKTSLPEGLRRHLDVVDFGTPVKSVTTTQIGDRVRMVIEPQGQWVHSAYQRDDQFVVEVSTLIIDPEKLTPGVGYNGQKLSLNFQNIEIRSLLQVIADFTGFNVITSEAVTGSVTLRLQDVPWDQALDIILQSKGLGMRKTDNVIWIAHPEEIAKSQEVRIATQDEIEDREELAFYTIQLKYALAEDIAASLNRTGFGGSISASSGSSNGAVNGTAPGLLGGGSVALNGGSSYSRSSVSRSASRILSYRGTAFPEKRTNQVIVNDIPSRIAKIRAMIDELDVPLRQILIEARIVEAKDSFGKALGVKLGAADLRAQQGGDGGYSIGGGNRVAIGTNYGNAAASSGAGGTVDLTSNFVNLPVVPTVGQAATFGLSIFSAAANRFLNLELSALESDGKGKVISSPRVVTANLVKAVIEQGEELPYQVATSSGATSIAFKKINLKLEATPQITPEGNVLLTLEINKDTVGRSTPAGYGLDTKHIQTVVLVENGGTVVIGGIFYLTETDEEIKVPFLGDLPGVGNLFKNKSKASTKTEMLVFITPKMMPEKSIR